jgi:hypothetical protein
MVSQGLGYASAMPNPIPLDQDRGPCWECLGYGGVHDEQFGDTVCNWDQMSRKKVSRMPETGCSHFQRRPGTTTRAVDYPKRPR